MPYRWGVLRRSAISPVPRCCGWRPTSASWSSCAAGARRPSRRSTTATTAASWLLPPHARLADEAEDAVQHTFLAAYRDLADGDRPRSSCGRGSTRSPATAASRCCAPAASARWRTHEAPADRAPLRPRSSGARTCATCSATSRALPEDQRAALVLAELGAVSHDEIAHVLDVPREKVKALVFQARTSLVGQPRGARDAVRGDPRAARRPARRRAAAHDAAPPPARVRRAAARSATRSRCSARRSRVALPVIPTVGLKEAALGAAFGSGTAGGGAAAVSGFGRAGGQGAGGGGAGRRRDDGRRRGHTPDRPAPARRRRGARTRPRRPPRWDRRPARSSTAAPTALRPAHGPAAPSRTRPASRPRQRARPRGHAKPARARAAPPPGQAKHRPSRSRRRRGRPRSADPKRRRRARPRRPSRQAQRPGAGQGRRRRRRARPSRTRRRAGPGARRQEGRRRPPRHSRPPRSSRSTLPPGQAKKLVAHP